MWIVTFTTHFTFYLMHFLFVIPENLIPWSPLKAWLLRYFRKRSFRPTSSSACDQLLSLTIRWRVGWPTRLHFSALIPTQPDTLPLWNPTEQRGLWPNLPVVYQAVCDAVCWSLFWSFAVLTLEMMDNCAFLCGVEAHFASLIYAALVDFSLRPIHTEPTTATDTLLGFYIIIYYIILSFGVRNMHVCQK